MSPTNELPNIVQITHAFVSPSPHGHLYTIMQFFRVGRVAAILFHQVSASGKHTLSESTPLFFDALLRVCVWLIRPFLCARSVCPPAQIAQHAPAIVARATGQRLTPAAAQAAAQVPSAVPEQESQNHEMPSNYFQFCCC